MPCFFQNVLAERPQTFSIREMKSPSLIFRTGQKRPDATGSHFLKLFRICHISIHRRHFDVLARQGENLKSIEFQAERNGKEDEVTHFSLQKLCPARRLHYLRAKYHELPL